MSCLMLWPGSSVAQSDVIEEIRFVGNKRTKPEILLQELPVGVGDTINSELVERSRQAIMDLGLFKSVKIDLLLTETGRIVEITVDEKYYFFPLPRLNRDADGEVSYGVTLRMDNLGGLNQKVKFTYRQARACCGSSDKIDTYSLFYNYPRVAGTHYGLVFSLAHSINPVEDENILGNVIAEYEENFDSAGVGVSRWLSREGPSSGWSLGASVFWRRLTFSQQSGAPITHAVEKAVGLAGVLRYIDIHDYLFSRSGLEYGFITEQGVDEMGSDAPFSRNQFFYRHYFPAGEIESHKNLNLQLRFGVAGGDVPIDDAPYSLGGSRDLRAYEKNSFSGQSFFLANVEYLTPIGGHNALRGVAFVDFGNTYADNRIIDFGDVEKSAGLGLRYRVKSFVNLQLRIDMGYAFGLSQREVYVGTKNSF